MDMQLQDKSVIVTGGGSNIGRAIVLAFAAEKAKITIADIDPEQAQRVATEALARGAAAVQVIKTDVTNNAQVNATFDQAAAQYGGIDVVVNNVGWDQLMFFTQTTPELWHKLIQINYVGLLNCAQAALKHMIPANKGAIVAISSDASRQGEPREAVYAGTKAAVNGFMKSIARENGRYGIRCNVVCPGVTVPESVDEVGGTSMWAKVDEMFSPEQFEKIAKTLPLRKLGRPADIAGAVVFLSSPRAGHVTGQVLSASGGYSMIG
ncbi:MAG: SDR family oxidoreductase [Burkholderiaceae bacterium]|nr:SDR family oxidoreductase [Burkholderiaceae bacterium]